MFYSIVLFVWVFVYVKVKVTPWHAGAEVKRETFRNHSARSGWVVSLCVYIDTNK